jgi:hypothetical protein
MTILIFGVFLAYPYIRTKALIYVQELQMVKFIEDSYFDDTLKLNLKQ